MNHEEDAKSVEALAAAVAALQFEIVRMRQESTHRSSPRITPFSSAESMVRLS
jgi:hypothetical protein